MRHYLKKPNGKAKSFAIYLRTVLPNGKTKNEFLDNKDLDAINQKLRSRDYSLKEANTHAENLKDRLNVSIGADEKTEQVNLYNQRLLDKYWNAEYSHREIKHENDAKNKLIRAVAAIGNLPLATADRKELQLKIKQMDKKNSVRREITVSLNQLLRYAGRDFKLQLPKKEHKRIPDHLTLEELEIVAKFIEIPALEVAARITLAVGTRIGELLGSEAKNLNLENQTVYIGGQFDTLGEYDRTKTGVDRDAFIFADGIEYFKNWDQYREECIRIGHSYMSKLFKRACMKAFPDQPNKHCTLNDLRHGYAVRLIPIVGFDLTSQSMGNSEAVCREFYGGLSLSKAGIETIRHRVAQAIKEKL